MHNKISRFEFLKAAIESVSSDDFSKPWDYYPCLEWPHSKNGTGYGTFATRSTGFVVHKVAYELSTGIPLGKRRLSHYCGNRACFRPVHIHERATAVEYLREIVRGLSDDRSLGWETFSCMEWPYQRYANGYGKLWMSDERDGELVHRTAYQMAYGAIANDLKVCHHCDNRPCFRPVHLFAGTQGDNVRDMISKGRQGWEKPRPSIHGELHCKAILTWDIVNEMRSKYAAGVKASIIGDELGISRSHAHHILKNRIWKR